MPRYTIQFAYTANAWAALAKNPVDRRSPVRAVLEKVGGKLIDLYYHFGEYDGIVLAEAPDDAAANAAVIAFTAVSRARAKLSRRVGTTRCNRRSGSQSRAGPQSSTAIWKHTEVV